MDAILKSLVTGGAGYIGAYVVEDLLLRGHEVVVLDTLNWGAEALEPYKDNINIVEGDVRSSKDVIYAMEGCDSVIHLAGIVGEPACKVNYKAHYTINVESTRNMVNLCTDPNLDIVRDFIFLSSCSVYGNMKGLHETVTEDTPPSPLSWYADGKLQSEQIIAEAAERSPHFRPTILRLTTVFGWSPRPRLDLVTNLFVYKALTEGKLTIWGDGMQYRSLIHVKDVAQAAVETLCAPAFMRNRKTFHVGEEANNVTVREVAETVKKHLPDIEIEYKIGQPTDRRDYKINCQRLKNTIAWEAKRSLEDGIIELIHEIRTRGWDWSDYKYRNNEFNYE